MCWGGGGGRLTKASLSAAHAARLISIVHSAGLYYEKEGWANLPSPPPAGIIIIGGKARTSDFGSDSLDSRVKVFTCLPWINGK